ncbi:hypothetical protein Cgig2_034007 [Carnegiea gigantea]|uniref:Uncharacterized protein n=1 Tax=Carnegiea gigantea TaxID=171969 RepID=A0A9Q1JXF8_9CARY|nr:hypothetical protein Cgig2_034007 [Carnegiea gigantea]
MQFSSLLSNCTNASIELYRNSVWDQGKHWIKKEQCQQPHARGGLGIQDLVTWNYALLMRQAWRIQSKPHLLIAQIYRGKYGTHSPIETTYYDSKESNASWGRKGVTRASSKLRSHVDPTSWKNRPVSKIQNWHIRPTESPDRLYWSLTNNGEYNSKSSYIWLMSQNKSLDDKREVKMWKILWALRIPSCWKQLWWVLPLAMKVGMNPNIPWTQWVCDWILMLHCSHGATHRGVEIFVTVVWSIWFFQNQVLHQAVHRNPLKMVDILWAILSTLSNVTTRNGMEGCNPLVSSHHHQKRSNVVWGNTITQPIVIIQVAGAYKTKQ